MGKIKVLPEMLINKIAAGEVVEKPASVVKELVENSLDANANTVSVTIKHGGKQLVRVTDNGEGMGPEDAVHSLQRHATSKIENLEDIFRIRSFGFRGEALPSIAAVSRLTLLTRPSEAEAGTEIKVTGGEIESVREAGVGLGSTVEAADLFFNIPARKKFLRSERSEFVAILDTLTVFALGNPAIDFRLYKESKLAAEFPSCVSLRERIAHIHDKDVAEALIPLQANTPEIKISGFITAPEVNRVNRTGQYFFINGRPIKSPALSFSLLHGYEEMLPRGRYPLGFLFFNIALSRVDVNVHPNKKEVRIENEREVQTLLIEAVQQALHTKNKFPTVQVMGARGQAENGYPWGRERSVLYPEYTASPALGFIREAPADPFSVEFTNTLPAFPFLVSDQAAKEEKTFEMKNPKILGQFQATYLVAEREGKLLIIDQHAAHERIMYEKILDILMNSSSPSQLHLIPITFALDYREQEVMEEYLPLLEKMGFGINNLGRNTFSVDAAPSFLEGVEPKQLLLDFVHDAMERQCSGKAFDDKMKSLAASIACKTKSIKGSSHLLPEKMEHLVKSLFQTKQPFTCPHGRPTCITLTNNDLEKQFGRK